MICSLCNLCCWMNDLLKGYIISLCDIFLALILIKKCYCVGICRCNLFYWINDTKCQSCGVLLALVSNNRSSCICEHTLLVLLNQRYQISVWWHFLALILLMSSSCNRNSRCSSRCCLQTYSDWSNVVDTRDSGLAIVVSEVVWSKVQIYNHWFTMSCNIFLTLIFITIIYCSIKIVDIW